MSTPTTTSRVLDDEELISLVIQKRLDTLAKLGHFPPMCDAHGRNEIATDVKSGEEFCNACAADGFTGELGHFATDSEAIEMAGLILRALRNRPVPMSKRAKQQMSRNVKVIDDAKARYATSDEARSLAGRGTEDLLAIHRGDCEWLRRPSGDIHIDAGILARSCLVSDILTVRGCPFKDGRFHHAPVELKP